MEGIYLMYNKMADKYYVGQGKNVHTRWSHHLYSMRRGIHHNHEIQEDYNKYGEESFTFSLLEECTNRDERETYWIEEYAKSHKMYNKTSGGVSGYEVNPSSSNLMRQSLIENGSVRGSKNGSAKLNEVDVYDIKLRFIKGDSYKNIQNDYPQVSNSLLYSIKVGDIWSHILSEYNDFLRDYDKDLQQEKYELALKFYKEGHSLNSIAKLFHISRNTIKQLIHNDNTEVND